jgi:hypothetical protein
MSNDTPESDHRAKIANLAQLGVARARAISNFNNCAAAAQKMGAAEAEKPGAHTQEQMDKTLIELETARAIMIHAMASYKAAVNGLVPGSGDVIAGVPGE